MFEDTPCLTPKMATDLRAVFKKARYFPWDMVEPKNRAKGT